MGLRHYPLHWRQKEGTASESKSHCLALPLGPWETEPRTFPACLWHPPEIPVSPTPPQLWARHDPGTRPVHCLFLEGASSV